MEGGKNWRKGFLKPETISCSSHQPKETMSTLHCTPTSSSILDNEVDFFRAFSSPYFTNLVKLSPKNTGFLSRPARELTYVLCLPVIGRKKARISKYLASACPTAQCSSELNAFQLFLWQSFLSFYSSAPKSWNLRDSSTVYDSWVLKGRRSDYGGSDAYSSFFFYVDWWFTWKITI